MLVGHHEAVFSTTSHFDVVDVTDAVHEWLAVCGAGDGQLSVFVPGSTGAVTTIEYESGALADLKEALERIAPSTGTYHHDQRWGDGNGFSHLRAALLGPSVSVPVVSGRCCLGTWQQIVIVNCDNRPRDRRIIFSFVGSREEGTD